ncbi:MAG: hypothetical protein IJX47_05680 [Clostridia bacterium]|nr:hypothetical protein [Clostridia bacterium]
MKKIISLILTLAMLICATAVLSVSAAEADPAIPIAKSGNTTLTGITAAGSWEITAEALTTKEGSIMVFSNDRMEAGKLTATFDRGETPNTDGIIFCLADGSDSFWQDNGPTYYFLYIQNVDGAPQVGLVRTGSSGDGKQLGFAKKGTYTIPEDKRDNVYTLSAEWDASGKIVCYLEGEKVIEWTDGNPLQGTRYGLRASGVGVTYSSVVAEPGTPSPDRIIPRSANAISGTVTVDGVIDDAWADAPVYTMENEVTLDSTGDEATRKDSSTVKFRMMYDNNKIYMLVEITDDAWISGYKTDDWKNDSLMIMISENDVDRSQGNSKSYCLCAFLENYSADNSSKTGLIVRSNKGTNNNPKEHAVVIDGNKAVMELSFQLNTKTPAKGDYIVMDLQYNDQDSAPTGDNTRSIVWSWSTSDPSGPNQIQIGRKGWGYVNFASACQHTETELQNFKEATSTEAGYTGDKVCKECGETVETGSVVPATGMETPDPVDPPVTGDAVLTAAALVLIAAAGVVLIARRRKVTE